MSKCLSKEVHCEDWCEQVRDNCPEPDKRLVEITAQHAYSLGEMVKWFKDMIEHGAKYKDMSAEGGRSDELTIGYCDELLEDLK